MSTTLLHESFARLSQHKEEFAATFYRRLQERYPHLRPFFAQTDMPRQQGTLIATLAAVVKGIERGEDLKPILRKIGQRHNERRIRAEHYPPFGATLLDTMAQYDPDWTPALREAWAEAIGQCVRAMMESYDPTATIYRVQVSGVRTRRYDP